MTRAFASAMTAACILTAACAPASGIERASEREDPMSLDAMDLVAFEQSYIDARCTAFFRFYFDFARAVSPSSPSLADLEEKRDYMAVLTTGRRIRETGESSSEAISWMGSEVGIHEQRLSDWYKATIHSGVNPHNPDGLFERDLRFCEGAYDNIGPEAANG